MAAGPYGDPNFDPSGGLSMAGGKAAMCDAAAPSQMGRFETRWLATEKSLSAFADLSGR